MKVLFAAGGTGGHIIPALTVAEELRSRRPGIEVAFVGSASRLEGRLVPQAGFRLIPVSAAGFPRRLTWRWLPTMGTLAVGWAQVIGVLRRERPRVVFGTGGYVCGPLLAAAALSGIPTVIHEANVVAGLTNRWLGHVVNEVYVGFDEAADAFPRRKTRVSGNPLRKEILAVAKARSSRATNVPPWTLAVIGGSQGSRRLNETVVASLPRLSGLPLRLIHQTGEREHGLVCEAYKRFFAECPTSEDAHALATTQDVTVEPFFKEMGEVYSRADLILCRAGAMTLSEIAVCGIPAILVPLPGAQDQPRNARYAEKAGAALCIADAELTPDVLAEVVARLLAQPHRLTEMSRRWKPIAKPDATQTLTDALERYL